MAPNNRLANADKRTLVHCRRWLVRLPYGVTPARFREVALLANDARAAAFLFRLVRNGQARYTGGLFFSVSR
jgi:hypothetical protein